MKWTEAVSRFYGNRFPKGSLRKRFTEGMTWAITGTLFRQAANFVAGMMVARLLGVSDFGKLAVVQSTVLMLANFGQAGIGLAATQRVAGLRSKDPSRAGRVIGFSLVFTGACALLVGLLFFLFSSRIASEILPESDIVTEIMIAGGWIAFEIISLLQLRIMTGLEAFRSSAFVNLFQGIILIPILYCGAYLGGVSGAVTGLALVSIISSVIGQVALNAECGSFSITISYRDSWKEKGLLGMSAKVWLSDIAMNATNWLAGILLARQPGGLPEFGLFNAANRLQNILLFLPARIFQVSVPVLSNLRTDGNRRGFTKALLTLGALAIVITGAGAVCFLVFSEQLMSLFGSDFSRGSGVLQTVALVCVASAAWTVATAGLWAAEKANQMLILDTVRGLLLISICLSGAVISARGLAFAHLISYTVGLVLLVGVLVRFLILPWTSDGRA